MKATLRVVTVGVISAMMLIALTSCGKKGAAVEFQRDRLNDGIFVSAPDNWRWARDGIEKQVLLQIAGDPITGKTDTASTSIPGELVHWTYATEIPGTVHTFSINREGFVVFARWYEGLADDNAAEIPHPLGNGNLSVRYPRCVPMAWSGRSEIGFHVEVDIQYPSGEWHHESEYFTRNHAAIHQHTGANPGRWRVRTLTTKGAGPWSEYVTFKCTE